MYRTCFTVALFVILIGMAGCASGPASKDAWFTKPGHVLTYDQLNDNGSTSRCVVSYTMGRFNGVRCTKASSKCDALTCIINMYYSTDSGFVKWLGTDAIETKGLAGLPVMRIYSKTFKPPISLLLPKPTVGDSLKGSTTTYAINTAEEVSSVDARVECIESVTVPAGTFECRKVVLEMREVRGTRSTEKMTFWFAKGIGIVKSITFAGKQMETLSLVSYK